MKTIKSYMSAGNAVKQHTSNNIVELLGILAPVLPLILFFELSGVIISFYNSTYIYEAIGRIVANALLIFSMISWIRFSTEGSQYKRTKLLHPDMNELRFLVIGMLLYSIPSLFAKTSLIVLHSFSRLTSIVLPDLMYDIIIIASIYLVIRSSFFLVSIVTDNKLSFKQAFLITESLISEIIYPFILASLPTIIVCLVYMKLGMFFILKFVTGSVFAGNIADYITIYLLSAPVSLLAQPLVMAMAVHSTVIAYSRYNEESEISLKQDENLGKSAIQY